jgi:GH15 family glucan-1,4-alpha-glucosidase
LQLVGVPSDHITHDYLLTRVGTETARQSLFSLHQAGVKDRGSDSTPFSPGMLAFMSVKDTAITTFVESIESRFKEGIVGYLKTDLGFTEEDIEKMRVNLAPSH